MINCEDALLEATLEFCLVQRTLDDSLGQPGAALGIMAEGVAVSTDKFNEMDPHERMTAYYDLITEYEKNGMFLKDGTVETVDMVQKVSDNVTYLLLGEIDILGTPAEEVTAAHEQMYESAMETLAITGTNGVIEYNEEDE